MTTVDAAFDRATWIGLPSEWGEQTWPDHRAWAGEVADLVWDGVQPEPGQEGRDHLALTLTMLAEGPWAGAPEIRTFLWLPGPGSDVLPVHLEAYAAEGDRDEALRELAFADAPAVEPPVVEPVSSPHLGDGIRVLRYAVDPEDDAIVVSLAYAWRAEGLDVRLWTSTSDTRLVLLAAEDVEALAQEVRLVDGSGPQRPL